MDNALPAGRSLLAELLQRLYERYNTRAHAAGDPVRFPCAHDDLRDREVAGVVAALLAYGGLGQILKSVGDALGRLGPHPARGLLDGSPREVRARCRGFVHRFTDERALAELLLGVRRVLRRHGSLQSCFLSHDVPGDETVLAALAGLAAELGAGRGETRHFLPDPAKGSACKRWHLFLRWMVRRDEVDPGGWGGVDPARLVVPLDTHTWRICSALGLTARRTCNLRAALDITAALRARCPEDPVRYDFAIMHASRAGDLELMRCLRAWERGFCLDSAPIGRR